MFCFILRVFFQDIFNWDRAQGGVTHYQTHIPQVAMLKVNLPCHIKSVTSVAGKQQDYFTYISNSLLFNLDLRVICVIYQTTYLVS